MIKAILFDMDGVLIDAKEWHYEALNRALELFGMPISRFDHLTTFDGLPTRKKLELLSMERGLPRELHSFINDLKQQYTMELVATQCRPRFQHEYALSRLKASGIKLAVCSNSVRNTVTTMMHFARLESYLNLMLSNEDVARSKPDPEMYVTAMVRLGVKPQESLIVEDNEHGIRAAVASGAHVMRVATTSDVSYENIAAEMRRAKELQ